MRPKGQRESRVRGSMQGFLWLLLIQITVFSAASCAHACIPAHLTVTSYNTTSVTLSWVVPEDQNNTFTSFVSLFSSANKIQNYTTTNKELTITGLSPGSTYSVSISSLCHGTESIPSTIDVQTGPNPPLNITVVEQDVLYAFVRWTAPNDPNKDGYRYRVTWSQNGYSMSSTTVFSTERNITRLVPGKNYTVTVTSSYNNKYSQPATMTFTAVPCGGKMRAGGWLSSPGYPQSIYSNMDCAWDIKAPLGHFVLLTVVDLYSYYSSSPCYRGWLAVGYNQTSQRDITMCRYSDVRRTIVSPSNMMRVFYHTSSYYGTRRFNITLSSQDACIPADLTVTSYNTTSVTLSWVVPEDQNNRFISFVSLFSSGNKIQTHATTNKELTFTGLSPGTTYSVSISSLCNGTESVPSTIDVQTVPCGGRARARGWLSSPGYPQYINSNIDCAWDVKAPLGHVVLLTVVDMYSYSNSRCYMDWLAVGYNQTSQRDITMCHHSDIGRTIISPSNTMRVFYHTGSYYGTRRFNVTLSSQDACIPVNLTETSFNSTSVTLSWIVPKDKTNTFISFVSLFSSANKTQNYTTTNKELTITELSPCSNYSVSISSLCNGTESIPSTIAVQTGPSPPLNITVVEQDVAFASVRWTAPNDPNKDSYTYHVKLYLNEYRKNYQTVYSTEVNFTHLVPGRNYTLTVTSNCTNKASQPATITFIAVPCGGKVRAEGWLSSPGYPQYIYSNMDCVWDIKAPFGHVVLLTVMDLNSYHYLSLSLCNWSWLAVGYTQTSQRDITMCHYSDIGRTIASPANTLRVFFQTSIYSQTTGFNITLSSQDSCIPAQLKVVSYNVTSVTLSWIIPNDRNNTYLSIVSLFSSGKEIQNHTTMYKEQTITGLSPFTDYNVSIYSLCYGTESIPAWIDVQTGPSAPLNIKVVEQDVFFASVRWTAPNDPNKDNYTYYVTWNLSEYSMDSRTVYNTEINITHLTPGRNYTLTVTSSYNNKYSLPATITFTTESCGGNLLAEGWLVSPGFPFSYENNMDCVWNVRAPDRHVVVLTVVKLNLEDPNNCPYDWLGVAYTNTMQPEITMCQAENIGRIITSSSNFMWIFFRSDVSVTRRGFNITLSAQDGCIPAQLKVVSYNITSVTLSWIIPNDHNNTNLSIVSLFSSGKEIQNHTTMNKEQTITGLSPFTEYNVSISSLCNGRESIPSWIDVETGPSPPMNLMIVDQDVGFATVRWTAPNDPNKGSYRYNVTWYLNGYLMDSRTVYSTEFIITDLSPGNNYTVTVISSDSNKYSHPATITFTAVPCGGKLRAEGWLSSPDYRQNIYSNMHCVWDIEAPLGHVVLLTVVDLNYYYYYPSSECYEDWLAVGYNQTSQKDITMCHYSDVGRTIISTSNMLRVFYRKRLYYDAVRFNITLSSQEDPSLSSTASAGTQAGTDTTAIESTSSVSTVESSTHPTSTTETTISAPDTTTQPGSSATTLLIPTTSRATGETTISTPDTTSQTMSSSATHLVSPTSATSRKTSSVSTSTAAETTISAPDTTTQPASSATTLLIPTTSTATGNCNEEKCQKKCTGIDSCQNGGTCSCDATCTITCNCGSSYKGSRCEMGVITFPAVRRQDAPKVMFDMTVQFGSTDLTTSEQETMLREQFRKLSGFNDVSVSPSNSEGTTSDYPVKTKFHYNNDNINKIYNGRLKNEIAKTFGAQVRASQGKITLKGNISQQNVPREDLDQVFQCNTSYEGYIVSLEDTGVFCISPCNDTSYCNNHGNCSHLVSGPKCSCDTSTSDAHCKVEPKPTNLFKILFGTLGGLLGVGILLGIVCYCVKCQSPSKSLHLLNYDW